MGNMLTLGLGEVVVIPAVPQTVHLSIPTQTVTMTGHVQVSVSGGSPVNAPVSMNVTFG